MVLLRRALALALLVFAAATAFRPVPPAERPVALVVTRDLAPGSTLRAGDVRQTPIPAELLPRGALREPDQVVDRILAGAARQGETLTDVRLVDSSISAMAAADTSMTNVPLRLSDPEIAEFLFTGSRVDIVALDAKNGDSPLLAADARVVAIRAADPRPGAKGRLIVVELPRQTAPRVAAVALEQPVTVTLR